jgi:hypothetical protein
MLTIAACGLQALFECVEAAVDGAEFHTGA